MCASRGLVLAAVVASVAACHPTIGTLRFDAPGESRTVVNLDEGATVRFWSDLDVEWDDAEERALSMGYRIELVQDGVVVASSMCDPLRVSWHGAKVCGRRMQWGHHLVLNCLMHDCELQPPHGGRTEVRAKLVVGEAPVTLRIRRADVLVSQ